MAAAHNIVLFIDGTGNEPKPGENTNVRKLFETCLFESSGPNPQITYYLPGVGTDIKQSRAGGPVGSFGPELIAKAHIRRELPYVVTVARPLVGGAFGLGTKARIKEAYLFLCTQFARRRGDRVFIFGFSRGAFAARSLAGFVSRVGTLLASRPDLVEAAYEIYEQQDLDPEDTLLSVYLEKFANVKMIRSIEDDGALPIHFLGVWDTVGALGLPGRLRRFTAAHTEKHQVELPPTVMKARHALALHELRAVFTPLLWIRGGHRNLEQVWFPGAHADVGGGYHPIESGLADTALKWMSDEASREGLLLDKTASWITGVIGAKVLHHEIRKWFLLARPTVRQPLDDLFAQSGLGPPSLGHALYFHETVAEHLRNRKNRPYKFLRPYVNKTLSKVDDLAVKLYIWARLLGHEPRSQRVALMTTPARTDGSPDAAPFPWWNSVSLAEFEHSATLINEIVQQPGAMVGKDKSATGEQLSRAVAIRILFGDEKRIDDMLSAVNGGMNELDQIILSGGSIERRDALGQWLSAAEEIESILRRGVELLPPVPGQAVLTVARALAERVRTLTGAYEGDIAKRGIPDSVKPLEQIKLKRQ